MKFAQCRQLVIDVLQSQREQDNIDGVISEPIQPTAEIVGAEGGRGRTLSRQLGHAGALVKPADSGAPRDQLRGVEARSARSVEDDGAGNVTEKIEARGTVVMCIEQALLSML